MLQATVYWSNRHLKLIEPLENNLFGNERSCFAKRLIIVPHRHYERWISMQLADSCKVAAGVTFLFLDEALTFLKERFFEIPKEKAWPFSYSLALHIEKEIKTILNEENNNPLWDQLRVYSGGKPKKICALSKHLASLFQRYSLYGNCELFTQWKKRPEKWQQALATRIFEKWPPLVEELLHLTLRKKNIEDLSIHLFGFDHLSFAHFHFFQMLGKVAPVYFYLFSPCKEFWSDIRSDKEMEAFFAHRKMSDALRSRWEELLEDRQPLLANLGKVGRHFAFEVEESSCLTEELYEEISGNSALRRLQQDILHLKAGKSDMVPDDSIQCHVSRTPLREIQALYHTLRALMHEKAIQPHEITVMAPNIETYSPYIQAIFGDTLPYRISDLPITQHNSHLGGFLSLFALDEKRWSRSALCTLFRHPLFAKKQKWNEKDLLTLSHFAEKASIRWGIDFAHRQELLGTIRQEEGGNGTWMQGIDTLFTALAQGSTTRQWIDFTEIELVGSLHTCLRSLHAALLTFKTQEEHSIPEWVARLKALDDAFFSPSEEKEVFFRLCTRLIACDPSSTLYSFTTVQFLLQEMAAKEKVSLHSNTLHGVHFCSLVPLPSRVVCLLGMNEGDFPRREQLLSLDLLHKQKGVHYCPQRQEMDRYFFLEALFAASDFFLISCLSNRPQDQTLVAPASIVMQLMAYLDSEPLIHPPHAFDSRYFDGSSPLLKNDSLSDFRAATALTLTPLSPPPLSLDCSLTTDQLQWIEIKDLMRCVANPLRFHFQKGLELYFDAEEKGEDEEFCFPFAHLLNAQKQGIKHSISEVEKRLSLEGKWPEGHFKKVSSLRLEKEIKTMHAFFSKGKLDPKQMMTFDLIVHQDTIQEVQEGKWHLPPLSIQMQTGDVFHLVGTIEGVFPQGLLSFERGDLIGCARTLPLFAILHRLQIPGVFEPLSLYFVKDHSTKDSFSQISQCLDSFVEYYLFCKRSFSFLMPDWIDAFLKKDATLLKKQIEELGKWNKRHLPEWEWLLRRGGLPTEVELIEKEAIRAITLYGEMQNAWF